MSTNWTDPAGDDYRRYTSDPDLGRTPPSEGSDVPHDAPPGQYVAPGTQPMPAGPPAPPAYGYGAPTPPAYGRQPGAGQAPPYGPPAFGQAPPYGPPASGQPAWNQAPLAGQPYPSYGQPAPGMPYGAYGYPMPGAPYAAGPPVSKGPIITLLVLSVVLTFSACLLGIPSLVLAIIALGRTETDPASAKRLSKIGWIVLGVCILLAAVVIGFVVAAAFSSSGTSTHVDV